MAQYLDFTGLSKYDELIKALINKADADLGERIDAVVEECGDNASTLAEIISLIGSIEDGKTLSGLLSDLNKEDENLRKLISEIAGVDSDAGESIASMSEIVDQLKNLQEIIGQKYSDGSDAETIVDRLEDLERDGEIYKPSQSLVDATNLSSSEHGGLGSHNAAWFKEQGYTYSQMFDAILFPTVMPTMTEPSLSWKNYSTSYDKLVGTDITSLVLDNDNIANYITANLGSWSLDVNSEMTASNGCGTIKVSTTGSPVDNGDGTYSMGTTTIKYQAYAKFSSGDDPKDNKGNVCTGMGYFSNGNKYSSSAYIYPHYNFYATTNQSAPGELVQQPVMRSAGISTVTTTQGKITLAPHTSATPWKIRLPKALQTLWMLNTSNGKYEVIEMSGNAPKMWKYEQETTKENGINYHVYTYIGSDNNSANIQIKF
ncbi:MAG: hypothetical protein J6V44_05295 [Methanobrevibacter sp.]|nr:hypothetical protein [Methanobrevibacter sp.]